MKQPVENSKAIVINQVILRNVDRTMKDISTWRQSHIAAERVIWPQRQRLYDLYKDVELDGHLTGLIEKRFSAILNKTIYFKNKAGKKVDEVDELIKKKGFRDFRRHILNTILWGIGGAEFIPGEDFSWLEIPRKHLKPEYKIISKEQLGYDGFNYEAMPNIMVMGETHDLGLFLKCAPYALWKRGGFADYAQFVEIFGQPVRIFEYDAYDIETKKQLNDIVENSGSSMALMIPKQAGFKMEDGKTANANGDLQIQFLNALNNEMSVIVLGNTETTSNTNGGSNAKSKTHSQQQMEITNSDMAYELQYLNSPAFIAILKSYGIPVEGGEFTHEQQADEEKLLVKAQVDQILSKLVPLGDDYFYEAYQRPKPDNYDELKQKMEDDKALQLQPKAGDQNSPVAKDKKPVAKDKPATKDLSDDENLWNKFRSRLADFFDPAHL